MKTARAADRRITRAAPENDEEDTFWLGGEALVFPAWNGDTAAAGEESAWDDPSWQVL